jgi:diaminohydroxyphosphoribosylaminopyrimidine deaminase / 5-amino-6-(5-phosphoribosylamino)uracil reductase
VACTCEGLDVRAVLARLAVLQVNELLVECGARLAGSFLAAGMVDEIILYVAPRFLGDDAAPLTHLKSSAFAKLSTGDLQFEFLDAKRIGDDMRLMLAAKKD